MLRYLERTGLVVPGRSASGYRLYGLRELNQLRVARRAPAALPRRDLAISRSRRGCGASPISSAAVDTWFAGNADALEWEQRKHERLLAA